MRENAQSTQQGGLMQASPVTSSFFLSSLIRGTVGNICKTCFGLRHRKASKEASKQASKYTSKKGRKEESKKPRKEGRNEGRKCSHYGWA